MGEWRSIGITLGFKVISQMFLGAKEEKVWGGGRGRKGRHPRRKTQHEHTKTRTAGGCGKKGDHTDIKTAIKRSEKSNGKSQETSV